MDRITTFVLLLVFTQLAMRAQVILDKEHNLPLVGDELRKVLVDAIDYKAKTIDPTDKVLESNQHIVKYFSLVEDSTISFSKIDDGILSSYSFMGGSLFLNGCENNQTRVTFLNPIKILSYPFVVGDSLGSSFDGIGMYVDKIPYTCRGENSTKYHSRHTLVTPDGDSIQPVYTLCNVRCFLYNIENHEANKQVCLEHFRSYIPRYRYPILETITYHEGQKVVSSASYYYPLDEQPYLEHDMINQELRRKSAGHGKEAHFKNQERLIDYDFAFQPTSQQVLISCSTSVDCDIDFVLASVGGIVYQRQTKHALAHEQNSLSFSCAGLPQGQYAVYISVGSEKHTEKFNIK